MRLADTTLWQRNLASLIRSGLFEGAEVVEYRGLHAVIGIYRDGSPSAPLAKYADRRRADAALELVLRLADVDVPTEAN